MQKFFEDIDAKAALQIEERATVSIYNQDEVAITRKVNEFKMEILQSSVEYTGIDAADDMTTVGTVKFVDMLNSRVLKKVDLSSYDYDESVLIDSQFVLSRDSRGGFFVEMVFKDPEAIT